jgi:formiminotetrahydrofolate cyclodeaminase
MAAYLDRLASADPTPGGGSAATLVGAFGAALCAMVARITEKGERFVAVRPEAEAIVADGDVLRERFEAARPLDEAAYDLVVRAMALPRATDAEKRERTAALQQALIGAAEAPLAVAGLAAEGFALAARAGALGNEHLSSDVSCALHFFRATLEASVANVRINHRFIRDAATVETQQGRLVALYAAAEEAEKRALVGSAGKGA